MTISQALQLAIQHHQAGRLADAEALYHQILAAQPKHADAMHFLGLIAYQVGQRDRAAEWIRQAVLLDPNNPEAYSNLGAVCRALGRHDEGVAACQRALELKPDYPTAHNNLGNALRDQGQFAEAVAEFRRALELRPDYLEAHVNLGNALKDLRRLDEALAAYRRALELHPDFPEAHINLGIALSDRGQLDEAVAAYRRALRFKPDAPEAHNNLGNALRDCGELAESVASFRRALQIKPDDAEVHSNLIFTLHFCPSDHTSSLCEEHLRWNRQFGEPLSQFVRAHANDRSPNRRLRVGYISPDFQDHPVGRYAAPLLERHDREQFEIICYSGVARPDGMTERFRAAAGRWRNTLGVSDARVAEMIREDGVDILVDLAMHTAGNRLPVFAHRPAPVQVSWLAYPGSTGLTSMDYRLTDACIDPPESRSRETAWSAEEPVRLPDCWCCYSSADECLEVTAQPALSAPGVTFGSLNNFAKVNEGVLALWAKVLNAAERSRILMVCPEGQTRERVRAFFGERGIAAERVELVGHRPRWEYLSLYERIDLVLDTFPCNGMTTTCDALWMGVPVLTLPGDTPVSRAGLSLLSTVGLGELVAQSEDDYVRVALELAGNLPRLADLRASLRPCMLASPLMDAPRFTRNVEAAYRSMWERWRLGESALGER